MSDIKNIYRSTPRQIKQYICTCLEAGLVPFLQSSPGMGKSEIVKGIADEAGLEVIDLRLSTCEPTDLTGLPYFKDGIAMFMPFNIFPLENTPLPKGKNGWLLFLDEFNSAPKDVQAAAYKLVLDRMIGNHKLNANCYIVAAGNLADDKAIVNNLSTAMQSRVIHLEMQISFEDWLMDVALKQGYDSRIIAFLNMNNGKLMDFNPDHNEKTFCCPRTWSFVNKIIKNNPVDNNIIPLLAGTITSGVAIEFVQFVKVFDKLVKLEDVLNNPTSTPVPTDKALMWATVTTLMEKVDGTTFQQIATYIDRFDLSFKILFYRSLFIRQPMLHSHPAAMKALTKIAKYINY